METLMELFDISKSYGKNKALINIDIKIPVDEIVGLIGPNGSGKTTILNIILGIIRQDKGTISKSKNIRVGSCILTKGFIPEFTTRQNISIARTILGASKTQMDDIIDEFSLEPILKHPFAKLSTGMQQIVALSIAFMANPQLVILDEPINGLDVDHILFFRDYLEDKKGKTTILMASHILSELEKTCTYAYFMKNGSVVRHGSYDTIINEFGSFENAYLK